MKLSWDQVNAWRLSQHHLLERAKRAALLEVVTRIGGVHAQLMSAAELALWGRVADLSRAEIEAALWRERTLVKTWAMRGTLHLLPAKEFPRYIAARAAFPIRRPPSYYKYHGVTPEEFEAILTGLPATLSATPLTREELAEALAQHLSNPHLRQVLLSGWGALLKPLAFRGELCFGPNQGQNVTFVDPGQWLGEWSSLEPQAALQEMARRYLRTYGPATTDDFARWWGITAAQAKKLFRSLADELAAVEVEGWPAWALASTLAPLQALDPPHSVRLLPQFDAYVVGLSRDCEAILPGEFKDRVYRRQGWISAVVLVDGRMAGVWQHDQQRAQTLIKIDMFSPPTTEVKLGLEAEAARLAGFLGTEIKLTYE